ncbi:uncharacterized protein Z520_06309 [Fonsecaea multimorphosa CBS 102226]|uniref:MARVEL domain-containing protein n=1 Tax=Fonsecaea multimorphosa CBS 102226 TaxID=1442371 RepID=A0A0D2K4Y1_9EURO|nr:uncharacterized protein Z520_06309 [Fonsecaea multimorphosa CBS 102226]KIX98229.1 hypothetical protein Z520_06309 [Fonsecaea multimorphosa CBS 102226]OAL22637.1 hypothetical protein AYO22_07195 [Fonsecaea multimorphosa]
MRLSSLLTLACAITAFILSILSLLAGDKRTFLQDTEILTLNISRLGHGSLFTSSSDSGLLSGLSSTIQQDINDIIGDATTDIASLLGLPDFFNVHATDYCQGDYSPNSTVHHAKHNVTHCSKSTLGFHFQPTKIVQDLLPDGITLDDIHWPSDITNAEHTIKVVSRIMVIFYIIGIVLSGVAMFTAAAGIFTNGRLSAFFNWLVDVLAFVTLGVASAVATAVMVIATNRINKYTDQIGIASSKGGKFLAMTWAATAVMLLASFVSLVQCCVGRPNRAKRYGGKDGY